MGDNSRGQADGTQASDSSGGDDGNASVGQSQTGTAGGSGGNADAADADGAPSDDPDDGSGAMGDGDGDGSTDPSGDGNDPNGDGDGDAPANPDRTGLDALICDGEPGITFAAINGAGNGLQVPGSAVMSENGSAFVLVEGTCRFWVQVGRLERVVTGVLSEADLAQLRQDFQLDRFEALARDYPPAGFDTPNIVYLLGRSGLQMPCAAAAGGGGCIHVGPGTQPGEEDIGWMFEALWDTAERLQQAGEHTDGDVRYLLVRGSTAVLDYQWSNPAGWPLGDPDAVAIDQSVADNGYTPGTSTLANGTDAEALHEVWRQFLDYEVSGREPNMPASGSLAIPVEVGSVRYQLFIRDSIPLENAQGLIDY